MYCLSELGLRAPQDLPITIVALDDAADPSTPRNGVCNFRGCNYRVTYRGNTCDVTCDALIARLLEWLFATLRPERRTDREVLKGMICEPSAETMLLQLTAPRAGTSEMQALEASLESASLLTKEERSGLRAVMKTVMSIAAHDRHVEAIRNKMVGLSGTPWIERLLELRVQLAERAEALRNDASCREGDIVRTMRQVYALDVDLVLAIQGAFANAGAGNAAASVKVAGINLDPCKMLVTAFLRDHGISLAEKAGVLLFGAGEAQVPFFEELVAHLVAHVTRVLQGTEGSAGTLGAADVEDAIGAIVTAVTARKSGTAPDGKGKARVTPDPGGPPQACRGHSRHWAGPALGPALVLV